MGGGKPYSQKKEGSGAFGARVLSSVRFAPNDGFCPQSGPVQREFYMPPTGGYTHRREAAILIAAKRRYHNPQPRSGCQS